MYSDCHVHWMGEPVSGQDVLKAMDAQEMEKMILMAPPVSAARDNAIESINMIADLCSADPKRLIGFAWIDPTLPDAVSHVELAVNDKRLGGVKLIPDHWYPYEERLFPVYEKIQELRKPVLFHSGILWFNMDSSRFCRPVNYEVMLHFPKIKFALAHIGWPWTDECIAVAGRFRAAAERGESAQMNMYVDITRGTPEFYRKDALDKALRYLGPERFLYGSDDRIPGDFSASRAGVDADRRIICAALGHSDEDFSKVARNNLEDFLAPFD